jgi:hypothetical protein
MLRLMLMLLPLLSTIAIARTISRPFAALAAAAVAYE